MKLYISKSSNIAEWGLSLRSEGGSRVAHQSVVTFGWGTVIEEYVVLVFGLMKITFDVGCLPGCVSCLRSGEVEVVVVALLEEQHSFVGLGACIVVHAVCGGEQVVCPISADVNGGARQGVCHEGEVGEHIVAFCLR